MSATNNKIHIYTSDNFYSGLSGKHLLLDTNVFIDAFNHPEAFGTFFQDCTDNDITLTTIDAVVIEFTTGSENEDKLAQKSEFVHAIVQDYVLHSSLQTSTHLHELVKLYKHYGKGVSVCDYLLAASLKQYRGHLYLLTKNPKDFPTSVFSYESHIILQMERALQIFGVYNYKE